jgi:hypothetical protein
MLLIFYPLTKFLIEDPPLMFIQPIKNYGTCMFMTTITKVCHYSWIPNQFNHFISLQPISLKICF